SSWLCNGEDASPIHLAGFKKHQWNAWAQAIFDLATTDPVALRQLMDGLRIISLSPVEYLIPGLIVFTDFASSKWFGRIPPAARRCFVGAALLK
ncbi:hypothetical protein HAX54_021321, partial [Datura stramonium]|nr:hypothetical protein [Datura stramonium]